MPANDFLHASDQELLTRADRCLQRAQSALEVPPNYFDEHARLRLFLEAQSCIAEVNRRQAEKSAERDRQRNEEIAERDFRLERRVVWLIGVEIILSIIFGGLGFWEGYKQGRVLDRQAKVLEHMDTSAGATAAAMTDAASSLNDLSAAQAQSLQILQKEEAERAKKPRFTLDVGHVPLAQAHGPLKPRQETDTTATFDIVFRNAGEANANKVIWRALVPPDVNLIAASSPPPLLANDLPDRPVHAFLFFQDVMPSRSYVEVSITLTFSKGHQPFQAIFNASSAEITGDTALGVLIITPRTSSN